MQGYNLEIRHIPGKRNPADTLSRQDKKDALGRKTAVNDANADLVNELRIPSDANDEAIQEALKKLFNAQCQDQCRDQSDAVEGQAIRASGSVFRSDQALKADSSQALKASDPVSVQYSIRVRSKPSSGSVSSPRSISCISIKSRKSVYTIIKQKQHFN